jgi:DNA-binding XRE family transcriptional regulator
METKMASPYQYTSESRNIHAATKSVDDKKGSSRGQNTSVTKSRERMATPPTNLGRNKLRKSSSLVRRNIRFKPMEKVTRFRRIQRSFKKWKGNWLNKELSIGERYWIDRIRAGLNQNEAAKQLEISRSAYQQLESRKDEIRTYKITDFEWCRIMRRRVGWTQYEVASQMGSSRIWVNRMEAGMENCDHLLWFWEQ